MNAIAVGTPIQRTVLDEPLGNRHAGTAPENVALA